MPVTSDRGIFHGQPVINKRRIPVSGIIAEIVDRGLEEYLEDFDLEDEERAVIEAVDYCRKQKCKKKAVSYCQYCSKNSEIPGDDVWMIAQRVYDNGFYALGKD